MSGGSYDYLYSREPEELIYKIEDMKKMRDRLIEFGFNDCAEWTQRIINQVEKFDIVLRTMKDEIEDIWRDIEWIDSGDGADIDETIEKWRKSRGKR